MATEAPPVASVVIPCFNEEAVLPTTAYRLKNIIEDLVRKNKVSGQSKILFVDDGSSDGTWQVIESLVAGDPIFSGLKLTRNFGHQYALYAGLMEFEGDISISMDADLQDDLSIISDMVDAHSNGSEIVFAVREERISDSIFKRWTAACHYWILEHMGIKTIKNHADFRLMSRRAVEMLGEYKESNLYLRGIVPLMGLSTDIVYYNRDARVGGESKYSIRKMVSLAIHGITSFSIMPLRFIAAMGTLVFCISLGMGAWVFAAVFWGDGIVPGWASTVIPIYLLGGLQLFAIGVAGEYIGKTYLEVKKRPRFLVDKKIGMKSSTARFQS